MGISPGPESKKKKEVGVPPISIIIQVPFFSKVPVHWKITRIEGWGEDVLRHYGV